MPTIPQQKFHASKTRMFVLLRKPDGTEARVLADFTMPSVPHPKDLCFACLLHGVSKDDIPVGTEVHRFIEGEPIQSPVPMSPSGRDRTS